MHKMVVLLVVIVIGCACGMPRDVESTLARIEGGTLRVGITVHEPWTSFEDGEPNGVEVELIEAFADELGASVEYTEASESELMGALEQLELDVVIGGLTSTAPWVTEATFTHPYLTTQVVVGMPEGSDAGDDIAGERVAVEAMTEAAGILEKTDAEVVRVDDLAAWDGAAAVDDWLLDDLGLTDTGVRLIESDHVFATPHGENAFLTKLERFLLDNEATAERLLEEHGRP